MVCDDSEDKKFYQQALKDTKKLKSSNKQKTNDNILTPKELRKRMRENAFDHSDFEDNTYLETHIHLDRNDQVDAESIIHYIHSDLHLSRKHWRHFIQGKFSLHAPCDLHGLTLATAQNVVHDYIAELFAKHTKYGLIIHGKGTSVGSQGILKNFIAKYLPNHPNVLACHSAASKHGGLGATYIMIKNKRDKI